jgi:membrane fusion protein, copper/silver efflux system
MKTKFLLSGLIVVAALGVGVYAAYGLGMQRGMAMSTPAAATLGAASTASAASAASGTGSASAGERKPLYWHDPMVPGARFDKPGKSPFMDMQLVPVYADEGAGAQGGVSISPRTQQNLGLRTAEVVRGNLAPSIDAVGSVAWNERSVVVVPARANGYVEKLNVRAVFDPVTKGQVLAELYVPEWVAAQEEFLSVRGMQGTNLAAIVDGARQRMRQAGMTEAQIARVEQAGSVQARVSITAPISGVIAELGTREGAAVAMGTPLFRINGLNTVWVNAEVPEAQAAEVRPGNAVTATTSGGEPLQGKVGAVLPEINATTRTLKVRVELPNPRRQLVPGMFATLHFKPPARADALLIPSEAVIATGERNLVMLVQDNGRFMPVEVERGLEVDGRTEIRKGLQAGQRVVLSGQFLVDSEASLKGVLARQGAGATTEPSPAAAKDATYRGEGKVESIGNGEVTLSHGPIPELNWGPMTMGFQSPPGGLPRNVAIGDNVVFSIRKTPDDRYQLTTIAPAAPATAPASGASR